MLGFRSRRLAVLLVLGALCLSGAAAAERHAARAPKSIPARTLSVTGGFLAWVVRLIHLSGANGAVIDPMGHAGNGTPSAIVPIANPLDDNGAVIDPMGGH